MICCLKFSENAESSLRTQARVPRSLCPVWPVRCACAGCWVIPGEAMEAQPGGDGDRHVQSSPASTICPPAALTCHHGRSWPSVPLEEDPGSWASCQGMPISLQGQTARTAAPAGEGQQQKRVLAVCWVSSTCPSGPTCHLLLPLGSQRLQGASHICRPSCHQGHTCLTRGGKSVEQIGLLPMTSSLWPPKLAQCEGGLVPYAAGR